MIIRILVLFGILLTVNSSGQDNKSYKNLVNEARKFHESKDYIKSAQQYSEAFNIVKNGALTHDRIDAASSWTQANFHDSAFVQLFKVAQDSAFTDYVWMIVHQSGLNPLHKDIRWYMFIDSIKINFAKKERNLNMDLVVILDSVYMVDQLCQQQSFEIANKYGPESEELKSFSTLMKKKYSDNLDKVKKILDEYGWLGEDKIGHYGNRALFLVIQHSNFETQKKYLPMMREAVKKGEANPANLALMEDRVALGQGKKQIYGTQFEYDKEKEELFVSPLKAPDNVNKRRAKVGLEKFEDYLSGHGIKWDPKEYKRILPELEKRLKK